MYCIFFKKNRVGFTVIELLVVITITIILVLAAVPIYGSLQVKSQLSETSAQLVQNLRWARENSISRYNDFPHGVFLSLTANPNFYTIYQGNSYASRVVANDRLNILDNVVSIKNINLNLTGDNIDINFSAGLGKPNNIGSFNLIDNVQGTSTININNFGKIEE